MCAVNKSDENAEVAARCHEIQVCLGRTDVPDFELLVQMGMAVRLALHIRGLPLITYEHLRMVASHFLDIPTTALKGILLLLEEIQFVRLQSEGQSIKAVLPAVPYYQDLYSTLGEYASSVGGFNEAEQLSLEIVRRLAGTPEKVDSLRNRLGADDQLFRRALQIGETGSYIVRRRSRGRDILLNPTYFSENAEIFADVVAKGGSGSVGKLLSTLRGMQGFPLSIVERTMEIGGIQVSAEELNLLKRLAQDGVVKPPRIQTQHSGENYFLFTPTPAGAALPATRREVYERAMAIVAAVRQGQLLPEKIAIRYPLALIRALKDKGKLSANTEALQQYKNLVHLRVGRLVPVSGSYAEFRVVDTEENKEALDIAYSLVAGGEAEGMEVDPEAKKALQLGQEYVESLVASGELRRRERVDLGQAQQMELELLVYGGTIR